MKRITFDKAIKLELGGWRKDYPGYLFEHSAHPGREFVIARSSATRSGILRLLGTWGLYDRVSGIALTTVMDFRPTRKEVEEEAWCALFRHSPEKIQASIERKVIERMTKILEGEAP